MPVLNLAVSDLAGLFLRLLPRGRVWPKVLSAVQPQAIAAIMPTYQRLLARDNYLLVDAFPSTTVELLPEWEASLGLPDPCAGEDPTIELRQMHVVARLTQSNGPSIPSLTAFAAALGYTITITEFAPARADVSYADDPCYEPEWAFAWQINASIENVVYAEADGSFADDPLLTTGTAVLQCEMARLAPAHTVLLFNFEVQPGNPAPLDGFVLDESTLL